MENNWGAGAESGESAYPFDGMQAERVVPADGDPAVPLYRASLERRMQRPPRARRGLRWWLVLVAALALGLLLVKPLVVVATVLIAVVAGLALVAVLAAGALLLAARFLFGAHATYPPSGWRLTRQARRRGWGGRWFD